MTITAEKIIICDTCNSKDFDFYFYLDTDSDIIPVEKVEITCMHCGWSIIFTREEYMEIVK